MDNLEDAILEKLNKRIMPNAKIILATDNSIILSLLFLGNGRHIKWKTMQDMFFENYNKKKHDLPLDFCQDTLIEYCKYFYLLKYVIFPAEFILANIYSKLKFLENCCSLEEIAIKLDIHEI